MNVNQSFPIDAGTPVHRSKISEWLRKRRWFILLVVVPTVLAVVYYGLMASDIYVSESRFVIKSPDQKRSQMSTLANLIQTTGLSGGQEQTNEVLTYVRSRDALKALDKNPSVRSLFSSPNADILSRFPQPFSSDSFEHLYKYYTKMIDVRLDHETGTAIITTEAFTARDAYEINRRLLELSEALVNRLNDRAQAKGIAEAQKQVDVAATRAKFAQVALTQYRNAQELIDPAKQALGVLEIANKLTSERAALQAQFDLTRRTAPQNPSLPALKNRIDAISAQIGTQDRRVVGTDQGIASKMGSYEALVVEQHFATENLNVANAALVQARAESQRQKFYLERVVDPNLPDMPLLPKRLLNIIVFAAAAACLYAIAWMFTIGILEHAPED
ncbi:N/A [soil metagenome]|uniref:capsule biosynthesis protein n=1 Tax=Sphingobium sp. BS19 TaxID=3018973 RepID=UPI0024926F81|nr:capsule biosynthesis protein [Sphingobium sp. BS19]